MKVNNIFLGASLLLLSSCVDLDQHPISSVDVEEFYSSENDIETAVNGIYDIFTQGGFYGLYNNGSIYMNDLTTEYLKAGANTNSAHIIELSNQLVQPTNEFIIKTWKWSYQGINRANQVIDRATASTTLSDDTKNRYVNEAKILRALLYFNIVRYYGDVPLVLHDGEGEGQARDNVDVVYEQIVSDLEDGANLPETFSGSTEGRATRWTALGILSKVYLTWAQTESTKGKGNADENYQKAILYADEVIDGGQFSLLENFIDNWSVDKKNGKEHIFSIQHSNYNNITGHCTFAGGWTNNEPVIILHNLTAYDRFDDLDQRKKGSFAKSLNNPNADSVFTFNVPLVRKYIDTLNYAKNQLAGENTNTTYLRYAEVLLIKAEAENELYGPTTAAYDAINQVRRRAYRHFPVTSPSIDDLPEGLSQADFRAALQKERFSEFVAEGTHWFDLVRWRILVKTVNSAGLSPYGRSCDKTNVSLKNYLFPIPSDQITLNPNLEQNWGYSGETSGSPYEHYEDDTYSPFVDWK